MIQNRLRQIEKRIARIKVELAGIGEMRPGALTAQYRDKEKDSGPYYQFSYAHEKKNHTLYIRADCVIEVRQQIENYKWFCENSVLSSAGINESKQDTCSLPD